MASTLGCGCGKKALTREQWETLGGSSLDGGVVHRPNKPCYEEHGKKTVGVVRHVVAKGVADGAGGLLSGSVRFEPAAAATPQPPPAKGRGRLVLPDLIRLLNERSDFGLQKYEVRLHTDNGRDPYIDALQEVLDLFVYLHQAQMEHEATLQKLATLFVNLKRRVKTRRQDGQGLAILRSMDATLRSREMLDEVEFIEKLLALVGEKEG